MSKGYSEKKRRREVSPFHLLIPDLSDGENPPTAAGVTRTGSGTESGDKTVITESNIQKSRIFFFFCWSWISLWLILWVWESRAVNTGWPGFSNEFDSSLCLLSLTGDQDCIITSFTHTYTLIQAQTGLWGANYSHLC